MKLVIVRHAERTHLKPEESDELTPEGLESVDKLVAFLQDRGLRVAATWHAPTGPARETAKRVASTLESQEIGLKGSGSEAYDVAGLLHKSQTRDDDHDDKNVIVLVGHEPKVSRLVESLTSKKCRLLDPGEGVCVAIRKLDDYARGRAWVEWASRKISESELLKEKLQSKVAVSTFLAGFFIAALVELVKDPEKLVPASGAPLMAYARVVSAISFTLALGLLLAAVYIYDQLAMPSKFWKPMPDGKKPRARAAGSLHMIFG